MTNFKFQCIIREHLLFNNTLDVTTPEGKGEFDKLILLTQEGYCRNLNPVRVGEKVAILLSVEEPTLSTIRCCFRVIRHDGVPITCGFQTIVCVSSETGAVAAAPSFILQYGMRMLERLESPSFAERILAGRTKEVFNDAVITLAIAVANSEPSMSYPRFVNTGDPAVVPPSPVPVTENFPKGIVFMFPGQGSYAHKALRDFYHADNENALFLQKADKITERFLGVSILNLINAETPEQHDALLERSPDLAQVGIYLGSVLVARYLMKNGVKPDCVVGHSAGELAALAIAGVYSDEAGVDIMCNRIRALQSMKSDPAGMLAVFCNEERARSVINEIGGSSLQISVVNHAEQTVVSGTSVDLQRLESRLESSGIRSMRLKNRYPFHSTLLEPAVAPFASFLENVKFTSPGIPAYSPIERGFYTAQSDMAHLLASHLVRPFTFPDALLKLSDSGGRIFIECGGGDVLSKLLRRVIANKEGIEVHSPLISGSDTIERLKLIVTTYSEEATDLQPQEQGRGSDSVDSEMHGEVPETASVAVMPVAIVFMGSVLPGAKSPQEFWRNILEGRSGISDAGELRPDMVEDFLSQGDVVPDKTYSLLGGFVQNFELDIKALPYDDREFSRLSSAQRFLASAMSQCLVDIEGGIPEPDRIHIYLGSTGDGVIEYDEALLLAGLNHEVDQLTETQERKDAFRWLLGKAIGRTKDDLSAYAPHDSYQSVAEKIIGKGVKVIGVDAACASSLYAIDLGTSSLRRGECDVAFCGGVFAPGPANSCLFSQFRGLSATGSRPLDASADGVVFGEGAVMLMLKRLPDAIAAGNTIHAVICGSGLSNDGKSPSVAVPRKKGQVLALRRAYEETGLKPQDIQYIEAHATATPVGDTEEFEALKEVFGSASISPNSVEVGSVKAIIGHTGWLAGAASVVKMTEALKVKIIPPQSNFTEPNPSFGIEQSPFRISTVARPWKENAGGAPKRVGVNGFGFGGSNAHVILEEYVPTYHQPRYEKARKPDMPTERVLSVVGIGSLFPFIPGTRKEGKPPLYFDQTDLKLPKSFLVLPDVADDMDKGQIMACIAASEALRGLGDKWKSWRSSIGVILGVDGKTGQGISANKRIYMDFLERRLREVSSSLEFANVEYERMRSEIFGSLRNIRPSGPYTLPGLMPNVTAGRVGNLLDLNGPNFVIDAGNGSLFEAICIADAMLSAGKAKMVLAGGINGYAGPEFQQTSPSPAGIANDRPVAEAGMILTLVNCDFAREQKLPVIAELTIVAEKDGSGRADRIRTGENSTYNLRGAEGALDIADAVQSIKDGKSVELVWPSSSGIYDRILRVSAPGMDRQNIQVKTASFRQTVGEKIDPSNPIYFCTLRLAPIEGDRTRERRQMRRGRLLILADQTSWQGNPGARAVFDNLDPTVFCPAGHAVTNAVPVDFSSEEAIAESLRDVDFTKYDGIIAVKDLSNAPVFDTILADGGSGGGLLDLMFAVVRQAYERLKTGETAFGSLCLNAIKGEQVHPYSGLLAGFTKAIARELPLAPCKAVAVDTGDLRLALHEMETEWGMGPLPAPAEIIYKNSVCHEYILDKLDAISSDDKQRLSSESVVIATGGGRGVTAVLVEDLLRTYNCRVILLGRTNPSAIPPHILSMSQKEFDEHETLFYREEMKCSPGLRISDLKKRYEYFRNAREIQQTLSTFETLSGNVEYVPVDITDGAAVDRVIQTVAEKYGKVDLIIHGAGVQVSKNTARKRVEEFRRIVATKIGGLGNLHRSFHKHFPGAKTHFHLITSVFSYFGNDGQPDYGAANEAMNHIANWMGASGTDGEWTSLAWLGWAGIGMTRGSEYEALARFRGLRPVSKEEGQAIFSNLILGKPRARTNLLISEGEIAFYKVKLSTPDSAAASPHRFAVSEKRPAIRQESIEVSWELSQGGQPYMLDHVIGGRPTYPGSFEVELAAQAAHSLRPNLHIVSLEDTKLTRFIKLPSPSSSITLRGRAILIGESDEETLVRVQLLSDFIHSSGKILQRDIVHSETILYLSRTPKIHVDMGEISDTIYGMRVSDPYLFQNAFVQLKGFFECLTDIEIGSHLRKGTFRIKETAMLSMISHFHTPSIMIDAMLRFSMINVTAEGSMPLYVPIRCREIHLMPGVNDALLAERGDAIVLFGTNPTIQGEMINNDWVHACDREGRVLLLAKDLTALKVGEVSARRVDRVGT